MTDLSHSAALLKAAMRRAVLAQRREAHVARGEIAAAALAQRVTAEVPAANNTIAGYWPLGHEIDIRPTLAAFKDAGAEVALPVVAGQGQVLIFRSYTPGDALDSGPFGTAHPSVRASVVAPTVLLLPLIAFDLTGQRLGYGAGYYDRTVAALRIERRILIVGVAYDEQEVAAVPVDGHDQSMDAVVTDRRTLWFNSAAKP
jgi:5-formyltetrahydrofolate cyclo-ligase